MSGFGEARLQDFARFDGWVRKLALEPYLPKFAL